MEQQQTPLVRSVKLSNVGVQFRIGQQISVLCASTLTRHWEYQFPHDLFGGVCIGTDVFDTLDFALLLRQSFNGGTNDSLAS